MAARRRCCRRHFLLDWNGPVTEVLTLIKAPICAKASDDGQLCGSDKCISFEHGLLMATAIGEKFGTLNACFRHDPLAAVLKCVAAISILAGMLLFFACLLWQMACVDLSGAVPQRRRAPWARIRRFTEPGPCGRELFPKAPVRRSQDSL